MTKLTTAFVFALSTCELCSTALAQSEMPLPATEPTATTASSEALLDPAYGTQTNGPSLRVLTYFIGFDVGVPLMFDVDRELVRPGGNLHLQGGVNFDYVGAFVHGGWRFIPVDFDRALDAGRDTGGNTGRDPLKNPYFGFGFRGQVPNQSRFLPYASVSFDFNFWNFRQTGVACGGVYYWWCSSYDVYHFTPGFSGRVGTAIHLGRGVDLDLGLGVSMSFAGDFFENNKAWAEPYLGILHRM
jgi:hypothetical protein